MTGTAESASAGSAPPAPAGRRRRLRSVLVKPALVLWLHWLVRRGLGRTALGVFVLLEGIARLGQWLPLNPLREACEDIAELAARRGHAHRPTAIYRDYVRQVSVTARMLLDIYRHGPEAVTLRVEFAPGVRDTIARALAEHGGLVLAVPHNTAGVLASMGLARAFPALVVAKNPRSAERTAMTRELFERMGVRVVLVREDGPLRLARACLEALRVGTVVVATLDTPSKRWSPIYAPIFGAEVPFPAWAVRFAARSGAPVLPAYVRLEGDTMVIHAGTPLVEPDLQRATQHYVRYFEAMVLADPASWVFLVDRRWRMLLRGAAREGRSGS